ncbi:MAG: transcription initiation factor IIB [Thermoproteota archaeon]|nr:transcription initiation factor IIB [Thermoproteota archaeon]
MNKNTSSSYSPVVCLLCNISTKVISDHQSGEAICTSCGSVVTNGTWEGGDEGNASQPETTYSRSRGAPSSLARHDRGLYTVISKTNKDAKGQQIETAMINRVYRWRTQDFRSQQYEYKERKMQAAFTQLEKMKDDMGLPVPVVEKSAYIYRKMLEKGLVKGKAAKGSMAAASYVACREIGIPRTLREVSEYSGIDKKELSKVYRKVVTELDLKVPQVDPSWIMAKVANKCGVSEKSKRIAMRVINKIAKEESFAGIDPVGLSGSIIYNVCKENGQNLTQYQIANATGMTVVTIRRNVSLVRNFLDQVESLKV